jgi:hypothetical protein
MVIIKSIVFLVTGFTNLHYHPINVPTAVAQAFLMDYTQRERAITHHAGPVRVVLTTVMQ